MAHPYTQTQIINALTEARGMVAVAARQLGCERRTVYNAIKRHPKVAAVLEELREFTTDTAETALFDAIEEKQAWAVCFYLKTQGSNRGYRENARVEHTGANGGPIAIREVIIERPGIERPGAEGSEG